VWDEAQLAEWATPVAGLKLRPTHISEKEYYSAPEHNLRSYPVYMPGREPGRNSLHLARNDRDVTEIDTSKQGMEIARKSAAAAGVKIATINIPMEEFDYGVGKWDLIVATYEGAGWREKAVQGLKPGGVVIVEGFLRGRGTPSGASFSPNELVKLFLDLNLRILRYEDVAGKPDWSPEPTGRVVRLCAQKPE